MHTFLYLTIFFIHFFTSFKFYLLGFGLNQFEHLGLAILVLVVAEVEDL